jgi:hypothetical protein
MGLQERRIVKGLDLVRRELALKTELEPVARKNRHDWFFW